MTWIADTEKRWLTERERDTRIEEQATDIYEALWTELLRILNEAKSSVERFADVETNGRQLAHTVSFKAEKAPPSVFVLPRSIEVALRKSEHHIDVVGKTSDIDIRFDIDICRKDGSACLKFEGKDISYEEASRRILIALLYPGLPYQEPSTFDIRVGGGGTRKPPKSTI